MDMDQFNRDTGQHYPRLPDFSDDDDSTTRLLSILEDFPEEVLKQWALRCAENSKSERASYYAKRGDVYKAAMFAAKSQGQDQGKHIKRWKDQMQWLEEELVRYHQENVITPRRFTHEDLRDMLHGFLMYMELTLKCRQAVPLVKRAAGLRHSITCIDGFSEKKLVSIARDFVKYGDFCKDPDLKRDIIAALKDLGEQ